MKFSGMLRIDLKGGPDLEVVKTSDWVGIRVIDSCDPRSVDNAYLWSPAGYENKIRSAVAAFNAIMNEGREK